MQDEIVQQFLDSGCVARQPWMVLTAGPMGAGKTHTMRTFAKEDIFPLDRFVIVDPDRIRSLLPEMMQYMQHHRSHAGTLTHKESGFIAEILVREAMMRSKNVLVDGSLRNHAWYLHAFKKLRKDYPNYRIAILLITASREKVYERASKRAATTGREVPAALLDEAMDQVPVSFRMLAPAADYTAIIDNDEDGQLPQFRPPATLAAFRALWSHSCDDMHHDHEHGVGGAQFESMHVAHEVHVSGSHATAAVPSVGTMGSGDAHVVGGAKDGSNRPLAHPAPLA